MRKLQSFLIHSVLLGIILPLPGVVFGQAGIQSERNQQLGFRITRDTITGGPDTGLLDNEI